MLINRYDFGAKTILGKIGRHLVLRYDFYAKANAKAILGKIGGHFVLINGYHFGAKSILGKIGANFVLIIGTMLLRNRCWAISARILCLL